MKQSSPSREEKKEQIIRKLEAEDGVRLVRDERLEWWLEQVVDLPDPHPEVANLSTDELLALVDAEVKQYRAEQREKRKHGIFQYAGKGGKRTYQTAKEADAFISNLRDEWES